MIRAVVGFAALCALGACGAILGPTQADLEVAVHEFYTGGASAEHPAAPNLAAATISDYEGCQPRGGIFTCPVVFSTDLGKITTMIWIVRAHGGGWEVRNIRRNERTH